MPPVVEPFTFAKSLHRGQRYNIMCTVVRGDLPVQIRWFKDGRLIDHEGQQQQQQQQAAQQSNSNLNPSLDGQQVGSAAEANNIAIKHLDPYSSTLTFASLQSHHRGHYSCEATNEAGRANQSSALVIHGKSVWPIGLSLIGQASCLAG